MTPLWCVMSQLLIMTPFVTQVTNLQPITIAQTLVVLWQYFDTIFWHHYWCRADHILRPYYLHEKICLLISHQCDIFLSVITLSALMPGFSHFNFTSTRVLPNIVITLPKICSHNNVVQPTSRIMTLFIILPYTT